MDHGRTLIDIMQSDEGIEEQFSSLHPDFQLFLERREDGLPLSSAQIIKYIVSCYDKESPIVYAYKKRWLVKKREGAILAGFPKFDDGKFTEVSDEVIFCQNNVINKLILRYTYLQHDRDFQTYVIYSEIALNQSIELMRYDFAQPAHAKAAKENYENTAKDIEALEFKIFSGEETKKLKDLLYEESHNIFNELRPERIAVRLEQGLPAVDYNPYGEYEPEPLVYMGDE